jgi:hypothetical protein
LRIGRRVGLISFKRVFAFLFFLATTCFGQLEQGVSAWSRLDQIDDVLRSSQVSGSLIYQGYCGRTLPEAPPLRDLNPKDYSGPPSRVLQAMLADVPNMRVSQEANGLVRMTATDIPTDLLDFKIHDMPFYDASEDNSFNHGPNMGLIAIEMNPEVRAFRKAHGIGPNADSFIGPGDAASGKVLYGHLKDVTVLQALDYILQTFPGFWIYENCMSAEGERSVRLHFYKRPFSSKR